MALKSVEKKSKRVSDQLSVLIQYMDEHRLFAFGKFQDAHNRKTRKLEWSELTSRLNEIGPAKTVDQWKKCWRNQKCIARKVNSAWKICLNKTGNSSNNLPPEPNDRQKLILSIIGTETSEEIGTGEIGFNENSTSIDEFEFVHVDTIEELDDLKKMVEKSNIDVECTIEKTVLNSQSTSEKIVPKTQSKTDVYKNLVDETNDTIRKTCLVNLNTISTELTRCFSENEETTTKSVDDNVDIVELEMEQVYNPFHSSNQLNSSKSNETEIKVDTKEFSIPKEPVIPGYIDSNFNKIKLNSSNEIDFTKQKKKIKSNDPVVVPKISARNVYESLHELIGKRSSTNDSNAEYKKTLYDLQIKRAKVELETALIEKEVAENKRVSEENQNKYKEEILKLEIKLKKKLLQK